MKCLEAIIYTEVHEFCDSKGLQITLLSFEGVGAQKYRQRKKNETISFLSPSLPHPRTSIRGSQATELDNYRQKENHAFLFKHLVRNFCLTKS